MKKHVLLIILVILSSIAFSQSFYGGLLGGYNASQLEGDGYRGYNKPGLVLGAWTQADLPKNIFWGMELKYSQKGMRIKPTKFNNYWKYVYRLNYIDLPITLGYQFNPTVSVFGGASFAYLFSKSGYNNFGPDPSVDYQNISPWEVGLLFGAKVNAHYLVREEWAKRLTLDMRFQYSAFSIRYPHWFVVGSFRYGQFNNVFSTTIYYRIERKQ